MLMVALQVKNVPDDVRARLAERAAREGVAMSEYVLRLLQRDLARPTVQEWLERYPPVLGDQVDVLGTLDSIRDEER